MPLYFIQILRPINLVIIAVSQLLLYLCFINPLFAKYHIVQELTGGLQWLFILDTVLIAAAGYVVNDIIDNKADSVNKPNKTYISRDKISSTTAWVYYTLLCTAGAVIAGHIAIKIEKPLLFIIYPLATFLLFMYSKVWKKRPLSGNIVVAVFCAFVPAIIWYAEADGMQKLHQIEPAYVLLFAAYVIFGILSTFAREIIKDLEDVEGDRAANYHTLPIVIGEAKAGSIAIIAISALISSYGLWLLAIWRLGHWLGMVLMIAMMLLPSIYILTQTNKSRTKVDYKKISRYLKVLMMISLFVFLMITINI